MSSWNSHRFVGPEMSDDPVNFVLALDGTNTTNCGVRRGGYNIGDLQAAHSVGY